MRVLLALFLLLIGLLILIFGDKPLKIKEGKVIQFMDFIKKYPQELHWLEALQMFMLKVAVGGVFIFFAVMIFLKKL
jgi:hypothetical protein